MKEETKKSVFATLNAINCNEHKERKGNLDYLSWAWAWGMVKENYPDAFYTIYENRDGLLYHTDGRTAWVKTGVTIEGLELIEYLPVMDYNNHSIPLDKLTSFDVNKAIQRSMTKACARHGLGLYIYAGEDLPTAPDEEQQAKPQTKAQAKPIKAPLAEALEELAKVTTTEQGNELWKKYESLQRNRVFLDAVGKKSEELKQVKK